MIIIYGILLFLLIIFIHETGHFIVGKCVGIKFSTFSVGMGPRLIQKRIGDTIYCLSLLPIGGYVRSNAHKESNEDTPQLVEKLVSFLAPISAEEKSLIEDHEVNQIRVEEKRPLGFLLYIFGGCLFNLLSIFPVTFIIVYFFHTQTLYPTSNAKVGNIVAGSYAYNAGFRPGDIIISVNNTQTPKWYKVFDTINLSDEKLDSYKVLRTSPENKTETLQLFLKNKLDPKLVDFDDFKSYYRKVFNIDSKEIRWTLGLAIKFTGMIVTNLSKSLIKSVLGIKEKPLYRQLSTSTELEKIDRLSSPVTAMIGFGYYASQSMMDVYQIFLALTFATVFVNLVPFPGTDGFQIFTFVLERWLKVRITPEAKVSLSYFGLIIMMLFTALTTLRDLVKSYF